MIVINQVGYLTNAKKIAVFTKEVSSFVVCREGGAEVFRANVTKFGKDQASEDEIWQGDFSEVTTPGRYCIRTEEARSRTFEITDHVYDTLMYDLTRAFYYLRCGMDLTEPYAGKFVHKACHTGLACEWENHDVIRDVRGGWHDAGDYGRYVTAASCALAHLLYAYQFYPNVFDSLMMNIPDHKDGIPDILTEARYELEWILKMQKEDGGVFHKATTANHAPFIMPELDLAQLYMLPVSSMATADFAAITACAARVYQRFDATFADRLLEASKKSAEWLVTNPDMLGFENPHGCNTGGYGEWDDADNRYWAFAELFQTTGEQYYHDQMQVILSARATSERPFSMTEMGYASVGGFGTMACLFGTKKDALETKFVKWLEQEMLERAEELKKLSDDCGYLVSMKWEEYFWGSNMVVLKHGMNFAIAELISKDPMWRTYIANEIHYLLGVNALDISYVTENGSNPYKHPHLRPDAADGIDECIPGMVSGGPNRHRSDPVAKQLIPEGTAPMKCYADHVACYSLNEITIYWNSPAVFSLAALLNEI